MIAFFSILSEEWKFSHSKKKSYKIGLNEQRLDTELIRFKIFKEILIKDFIFLVSFSLWLKRIRNGSGIGFKKFLIQTRIFKILID